MPGLNGNPLRTFFNGRTAGRGIWKWDHYFDIYDRHFSRFRGQEIHVLEIGVYSGGSLDMWHDYFGPAAHVYGVDLAPACKRYEDANTRIFIGDQADRTFWQQFKNEVPLLNIVVDDGGHTPEQQRTSMEELLPHLRPGGVYLCEDIFHADNSFAANVCAMAGQLNRISGVKDNPKEYERRLAYVTTDVQSSIRSVSFYPYVAVIEKTDHPIAEFTAPRHGTKWIDGHGP